MNNDRCDCETCQGAGLATIEILKLMQANNPILRDATGYSDAVMQAGWNDGYQAALGVVINFFLTAIGDDVPAFTQAELDEARGRFDAVPDEVADEPILLNLAQLAALFQEMARGVQAPR